MENQEELERKGRQTWMDGHGKPSSVKRQHTYLAS